MAYKAETKWGSALETGFSIFPNHLVAINQFLPTAQQVSSTEFLVLFNILISWWGSDQRPFPSRETLGKRCGLSPRQIQRAINGLIAKKILTRISRFKSGSRLSNAYDLTNLVELVKQASIDHPKAFKGKIVSE